MGDIELHGFCDPQFSAVEDIFRSHFENGEELGSFGHAGAGGSYGHADPERKLGLGYVMNNSHSGAWIIDPRPKRLLNAALASL